MINTARYLTNQLLYQRDPVESYDNRRNGSDDAPCCMDLILYLLGNILRDDFSKYNAKSYQHETRTALLNLCSFAYDSEVRLAAHMALDYVSAHMAVTSSDCRRMVPFRRRNEGKNVARTPDGVMTTSLLDWQGGADPMTEHMAMQAGATRAYRAPAEPWRPFKWSIAAGGGDSTFEVLADYYMPAPIRDLFLNDAHRRFSQALKRRWLEDPDVTGRNTDVGELTAASPSYLITAGGTPSPGAIDPTVTTTIFASFVATGLGVPVPPVTHSIEADQQLGVAVPSSFMPTGESAGNNPDSPAAAQAGLQSYATDLIQIGDFDDKRGVRNYGVAPDLLFGWSLHPPPWCKKAMRSRDRIGKFEQFDLWGAFAASSEDDQPVEAVQQPRAKAKPRRGPRTS